MSTIATLLEAEKEAAKTVQQARQYRAERIKSARIEAQKEIEALRQQKQTDFEAFSGDSKGDGEVMKTIEINTDAEIKKLDGMFEKNKTAGTTRLLEVITDAEVKMHPNTDIYLKSVQ